ncbi:MAG: SpoIIIAH-like family protein [Ruminococcus sp.]|jgi:stage III sporulation protein AH|nr:SpoIIIAH-like family protein [Ruminococcus sp.]
MRKPTIIIGKKHIILACLTLILGVAIYINYALSQSPEDIVIEPADAATVSTDAEGIPEDAGNYGDKAFVSNDVNTDGSDYFSQVRLTRMVSRDSAAESLAAILGGGDISTDETAVYTSQAFELSSLAETETMIESLIKAQGFADCVVYLSDDTANIVVKTAGLEAAQAAQIKDILLGEVTVPAENIRIFEVI